MSYEQNNATSAYSSMSTSPHERNGVRMIGCCKCKTRCSLPRDFFFFRVDWYDATTVSSSIRTDHPRGRLGLWNLVLPPRGCVTASNLGCAYSRFFFLSGDGCAFHYSPVVTLGSLFRQIVSCFVYLFWQVPDQTLQTTTAVNCILRLTNSREEKVSRPSKSPSKNCYRRQK